MTAVGRIVLLAAVALSSSLPAFAGDVPSEGPLRAIASTDRYRPVDYSVIRLIDGRLHFSQYDNTGNSFDLLSLGFEDDFSPEIVARGIRNGRFVARDERYLAITQQVPYGSAHPLRVIDRATGRIVGEIRLRDFIRWGRIAGGRLLLVQGGDTFSGGSSEYQAVEFELPELYRTKSVPFTGGREIAPWNGGLASLGVRDVSIYDDNMIRQGYIPLGSPTSVDFGTHRERCEAGPLRIAGDLCLVGANCGEIDIYDLRTRTLSRTIARDARFVYFTVVDGLLLSISTDNWEKGVSRMRAHDLATGRMLAAWRTEPGFRFLFAKGARLIVVRPTGRYGEKWVMTLYEVDTQSIRAGKWPPP